MIYPKEIKRLLTYLYNKNIIYLFYQMKYNIVVLMFCFELLLYTNEKPIFLEMNFFFNDKLPKIDSSNFYDEIIFNQLLTNISIGKPSQIIPLSIKLRLSSLSITSYISYYKNIKIYNHSLSSTYHSDNVSDIQKFHYDEFRKGIKSKELFEINKRKFKLDFIMATETLSDVSGVLGLKLNSDYNLENYTFLNQLKEKKIITSSIYFFIFLNSDNSPLNYKGKLILGTYPHVYNPKKYNKNKYYEIKTNFYYQNYEESCEMKHLEIFYGNDNNEQDFSEEIITNFDFAKNIIIGTTKFKLFVTEEFKQLYNEKCKDIIIRNYNVFVCDNDIDINKLKNIYIYYGNRNFTFILKPNDLFISYKNKLYYLINFYQYSNEKKWSFGITLLKKYTFVYDQEKKVIGFYDNKKGDYSKTYLKIFLIISFIIIILLSSLYIHHILFKKQRRIRANELEENIDYIPFDKKI